MKSLKVIHKYSLMGVGCLCTVLGIIGFVVPMMPGFVFILIASFCFSRSSERFHNWLLSNPMFGQLLKDYLAGKGIAESARKKALCVVWISLSITALVMSQLMISLGLLFLGAAITWYLMRLPSYK